MKKLLALSLVIIYSCCNISAMEYNDSFYDSAVEKVKSLAQVANVKVENITGKELKKHTEIIRTIYGSAEMSVCITDCANVEDHELDIALQISDVMKHYQSTKLNDPILNALLLRMRETT